MKNLLDMTKDFCKDLFTLETLSDYCSKSMDSSEIEREMFLAEVARAKEEWEIAKNNFEYITDKELVEQSIFSIVAAEKKYIYLMRQAQKKKYTSDYLFTKMVETNNP